MNIELKYADDNGYEVSVRVPAKWEICDCCRGNGSHVNPAVDGHGISREQFDEDPDFRESYFRGDYDVRCEAECDDGKTLVPDVSLMSYTQKRHVVRWRRQDIEDARHAREVDMEREAERRIGA